jgi:hypothetical protein
LRGGKARGSGSVDGVLVDFAVLHYDQETCLRRGYKRQVLQRIAIDQQQIGERAFLNDTESARVGAAWTGQCQQPGIVVGD